MGLFWKRKSKDQFVTLGLNEARAEAPTDRKLWLEGTFRDHAGSALKPGADQKRWRCHHRCLLISQ